MLGGNHVGNVCRTDSIEVPNRLCCVEKRRKEGYPNIALNRPINLRSPLPRTMIGSMRIAGPRKYLVPEKRRLRVSHADLAEPGCHCVETQTGSTQPPRPISAIPVAPKADAL